MQDIAEQKIEDDTSEIREENGIEHGKQCRQERETEVRKDHFEINDTIEEFRDEDRVGKGENEDHRLVPDLVTRQKEDGEKI